MDTTNEVKFNEWIAGGFELFRANLGTLILATLVVVVLSGVTLSILSGPLFAGLFLMALALVDKKEPKPQVGDVFQGLQLFLPAFLFAPVTMLVLGIVGGILIRIPLLGKLLALAWHFGVGTLLMFTLFLIADRKMDFMTAVKESANRVKTNFWPFLGLFVVAGVIGGIGGVLFLVGLVVTLPIGICILAVAYRALYPATPAA